MWDAVGNMRRGGRGKSHTDSHRCGWSGVLRGAGSARCRLLPALRWGNRVVVLVQTVAEPHVAPAPLSMLSVGRDFDGADLTRSTTRYHGNMESGALGSRNPQHAV